MSSSAWNVKASARSERTINPIRSVVDGITIPVSPADKPLIPLSLGDPSVFGNMPPPDNGVLAVAKAVLERKSNGYGPAHGTAAAREAIATTYSFPQAPLSANDVCIASGCSGALRIVMEALAGEGDNCLLPMPGFGLYNTIANNNGTGIKQYRLLPESSWEVDLQHVESLIDDKTKFILINNPSNPCGANYSVEHLEAILALALKYKLPIIADEIYGNMVFPDQKFTSLASFGTDVPIFVVSGIAKQFCVPGWRVGWIMTYDPAGVADSVKAAIIRLSQVIVGCNMIIQTAIPELLYNTPATYFEKHNTQLALHAKTVTEAFQKIPGLTPVTPQGTMYVMVGIDTTVLTDIKDDRDFVQKLLNEEFVFVLPGSAFAYKNYFRVVYAAPVDVLTDATDRIAAFCKRHSAQ